MCATRASPPQKAVMWLHLGHSAVTSSPGDNPSERAVPSAAELCSHADRLSGSFPGRLDWFWGAAAVGGSHGWQQPEQGLSWVPHCAWHKLGTPLWAPMAAEGHPESPRSLQSSPAPFLGCRAVGCSARSPGDPEDTSQCQQGRSGEALSNKEVTRSPFGGKWSCWSQSK